MSKIFDYLSRHKEQRIPILPNEESMQPATAVAIDSADEGQSNPSYAESKPLSLPDEASVQPASASPIDGDEGQSNRSHSATRQFAQSDELSMKSVAEIAASIDGGQPNHAQAVPEAIQFRPARLEIRSSSTFSLDLADFRIKSVLDPITTVGEQFRLLRARLSLEQKSKKIKSLLVTSAAPGEGKTFTSCSLAGVLAQEPGKRVLLIDGDMRRSMAGKDLGVSGSELKGLSDVLRGHATITDVLLSSEDKNLFFLPSGTLPPNPSELLSSPNLESSLKTVGQYFDWVIIDSPPIIALADTSVIAPICDAILLVVYANGTPSKLVQDSIQRIGRDKICGVIMNRIKHHQSSHYYNSYYSHKAKER